MQAITFPNRKLFNPGRAFVIATVACLLSVGTAEATINCTGTVSEIMTWGRYQWEGAVGVVVNGDWGTSVWILCSTNEGRTESKSGAPLWAVHDMSAAACETIVSSLRVAQARGTNVTFAFDETIDPLFASCTDVPNWGGVIVPDPMEDDGGRLGAWDGLSMVRTR